MKKDPSAILFWLLMVSAAVCGTILKLMLTGEF